jgi:site-specific DNA-methyltransferase (adenine-specific)
MKRKKMRRYENVDIEKLKPYENNARTHSEEQVEKIANSIEEFGFINPVLIDGEYGIIAGHGRVLGAKKLGMTEVPCLFVEDLTEVQKKAYILADNRLALDAGWDDDILRRELAFLDEMDFDITLTGFDADEFNFEQEDIDFKEDDYEPEVPVEPKSKRGQIYQLGDHRLMVGDSTDINDVRKLMNGERAELLFTDPPYNVAIENSQGMTIENDNMDNESFAEFLDKAFYCASESLIEGGAFYVWYASREHINFESKLVENGLMVKQQLIWVKNSFTFGRQDYKWMHEPCLYGWKEGEGHYFIEEYNHPTVIENKIDLETLDREEMKKLLEEMMAIPTTIIHEDKPLKNDLHPTMKPLKLCCSLIRNSSKKGEKILDLFGGSGSTLMSCEQLGRICYTMEYDPQYADVIIDRWEEYTGKKAKLLN